jgi:hypothetical protein
MEPTEDHPAVRAVRALDAAVGVKLRPAEIVNREV